VGPALRAREFVEQCTEMQEQILNSLENRTCVNEYRLIDSIKFAGDRKSTTAVFDHEYLRDFVRFSDDK